MFGYRVAGAMLAAASVLAFGLALDLGAGTALAQYEAVGKPLQLVPQIYSGKPAATPRGRVAAKRAAKSETKSVSPSEATAEPRTQQHVSLRRKHRPRTEMAEQRRPQRAAAAASAETTAPPAAAAAPQRMQAAPPPSAQAASAPPATASAALPPQAAPPAAPRANELMVGGQSVQVRSPDEANELDLAANEPSTTASAPASEPALSPGSAPLYNLAATSAAAEADAAAAVTSPPPGVDTEPAKADVARPKSPIGSAFWIMQIMAALGGAALAGSAAWFLIGSAAPRIKVSQWQEADEEV